MPPVHRGQRGVGRAALLRGREEKRAKASATCLSASAFVIAYDPMLYWREMTRRGAIKAMGLGKPRRMMG